MIIWWSNAMEFNQENLKSRKVMFQSHKASPGLRKWSEEEREGCGEGEREREGERKRETEREKGEKRGDNRE